MVSYASSLASDGAGSSVSSLEEAPGGQGLREDQILEHNAQHMWSALRTVPSLAGSSRAASVAASVASMVEHVVDLLDGCDQQYNCVDDSQSNSDQGAKLPHASICAYTSHHQHGYMKPVGRGGVTGVCPVNFAGDDHLQSNVERSNLRYVCGCRCVEASHYV